MAVGHNMIYPGAAILRQLFQRVKQFSLVLDDSFDCVYCFHGSIYSFCRANSCQLSTTIYHNMRLTQAGIDKSAIKYIFGIIRFDVGTEILPPSLQMCETALQI